ncbi:ferritin-like superfamily [Thamnocephalis sphaerospora]|uniref:Ferritin n=1 Tax=Thamnocephalis sphaerospora TaxID=78915 RepID=A0A4P9XIL6_9FUNG|nr:ferritin-like superfamily [Thamnocephalis sphaerospora]|eukprot:RKP05555.1 ferritin-like superfamily [Thamnocephalis sphaerospora]
MSLSKQNFARASEETINVQVNAELAASQTYLSIAAWCGRDSVALPGFKKYFLHAAEEEREHAQLLIDYQNKRGGKVRLEAIPAPEAEWRSAQNVLETALQLEKDVNQSLLKLQALGDENNDPQLCDFIESHFLSEQVDAISELSHYVTKLNRVGGDGLGLYMLDQEIGSAVDAKKN